MYCGPRKKSLEKENRAGGDVETYNAVMLPVEPESPSAMLAAIRSPMIFNAFVILMVVMTVIFARPSPGRAYALGFITVLTIWLNVYSAINPRFLCYGPREYLKESQLEHERKMAGK